MATTYPPKVLDLSFRAEIEGRHYNRPTQYVAVDPPVGFRMSMQELRDVVWYYTHGGVESMHVDDVAASLQCEWVAVQRNYQSYPSGGESHYASYAYWDGEKLHSAQGNGQIKWMEVDVYRVERSYEELEMPSKAQQQLALDNIDWSIEAFNSPDYERRYTELRSLRESMQQQTATKAQWWHWVYHLA